MFEDYNNMSEKTKMYFEKAREDAAREAYNEIRRNDFTYKAQYSSGFLVLPEEEFTRNTIFLLYRAGPISKTTVFFLITASVVLINRKSSSHVEVLTRNMKSMRRVACRICYFSTNV